jgi:signal transduction histidine kinase
MLATLAKRLLAPFARPETYRALLYHVVGLALGSLGLALLVTGWSVTLGLAITPLVFPLLYGLRWMAGQLARAQAEVANGLFGTDLHPPTRTTRGASFWTRSLNAVRDAAFWRQQAHVLTAWVIALLLLVLLWNALQLVTLPVWYRWGSADVFGLTDLDRFVETLPVAAVGLALLVFTVHLVGWISPLSRWLVTRLLSGEAALGPMRSAEELRARRIAALSITALVATSVVVVLFVIWELTSSEGSYFWPVWPLLSLALIVGIPGWVVAVLENDDIPRITLGSRALAIQVGASVVLFGFLVGVWAITGGGYFWPAWAALGLGLAAVVHAAVAYGLREHRIGRLEQSRAAAVDVQESELRRIERDLHDGAQARLVALGMSLGMAEEKLKSDPEGALALLAEARSGAREALEDLRDLARGIHPPILTDRGLGPAIAALTARSPVPVTLSVDVPNRPVAPVETAAYFVVAEALANAIKHAWASRIGIRVARTNGLLVAEITDDGRGGADLGGTGLTGLEQRVRALNGTLRIQSPDGGPTTILAELPCG